MMDVSDRLDVPNARPESTEPGRWKRENGLSSSNLVVMVPNSTNNRRS